MATNKKQSIRVRLRLSTSYTPKSEQVPHILIAGKIRPAEMKRGKTSYEFSDGTYEPFTHLVTLSKPGGSWYLSQVEL